MTDPELTRRAEQAYLGALLSRDGRHGTGTTAVGDPGPHADLTPGDFTDPIHQAIFAALTSQPGDSRLAGWLDRLRGLTERLLSPWARAAATYMARLPDRCPDPGNLDAYAAMITEASRHRAAQAAAPTAPPASFGRPVRQPGAQAPVLDGAATWLSDTAAAATTPRRRPVPQAPAAAPPTDGRVQPQAAAASPEAARLARALRASLPQTARIGTGNNPGAAEPASRPVNNPGPAGNEQPAPRGAEELERRLLATMLNDRAEAASIAGWMPAEAFSAVPLRDLYQLACQRLENDQPVDPLIIAWDASQLPGRSPQDRESLARLALQVGALDPAPPAGAALRRAVRADYILTRLAGPTWDTDAEHAGQLIPPALHNPGQRHGQPAPAPVTATATTATGPAPAAQPASVRQQAPASAAAKSPAPAQPPTGEPVPAQAARPVQVPLQQPPAPVTGGFAQRM
jgi:DnaB-like helicase N terminal domain